MFPEMTDWPACVAFRPASAVPRAWVRLMLLALRPHYRLRPGPAWRARTPPSSLDHGQQALHHLIGGRHHLGAGRIGLLGHDQMTELRGDIDVGGLDRVAHDLAGRRE